MHIICQKEYSLLLLFCKLSFKPFSLNTRKITSLIYFKMENARSKKETPSQYLHFMAKNFIHLHLPFAIEKCNMTLRTKKCIKINDNDISFPLQKFFTILSITNSIIPRFCRFCSCLEDGIFSRMSPTGVILTVLFSKIPQFVNRGILKNSTVKMPRFLNPQNRGIM